MVRRKTPGLGLARPTATMACSSPLYSTGTSSGLSRRQRKSALSTVAQARLISGRTPQKHTDWRVEYRSKTTAGSSLVRVAAISDGHCEGNARGFKGGTVVSPR